MERTGQFTVPDVRHPFPSAVNEFAREVQEGNIEWVRRLGLLSEGRDLELFSATGIGWLAARTHPTLGLPELQLISDWYAWLFIRDDEGDDTEMSEQPDKLSTADARLLEVLEGAEPTGEDRSLVHGLRHLRDRLLWYLHSNNLSRAWMRRFVRTVRAHLEATLWEASNRSQGIVPDVESYVRMRPLTGGLQIVTELVEIVEGEHVPAQVREHEVVAAMTRASHNVCCWVNDLISLAKELSHGEVNNLVVVLGGTHGLTLQEAIHRAAEMHDEEVRRFVALERSLPSFGSPVDEILAHYVSSLRSRMRGILDWSRDSVRYSTPG